MHEVQRTDSLTREAAEAVTALAEAAHAYDGVAPLSEQTVLRAWHGSPNARIRFLLLWDGGSGTSSAPGRLVGFAFAEFATTPDTPASGELVVAPDRRGQGHGTRLLAALLSETAPDGLRIWAHGQLPAAQALAHRHGLTKVRGLLKMRMPLTADLALPDPTSLLREPAADRLVLRTFVAGQDEDAWLTVNARAFADHPEQGATTLDDLLQREAEDWFDLKGFFVAEERSSNRMAGFHWTKIHADGAGLTEGEPVGEVYVVGVDPDWQGSGLGRALTIAGITYLRDLGLPWVLLYVEEDNAPAVRLYESLGFDRWDLDVMYATP